MVTVELIAQRDNAICRGSGIKLQLRMKLGAYVIWDLAMANVNKQVRNSWHTSIGAHAQVIDVWKKLLFSI